MLQVQLRPEQIKESRNLAREIKRTFKEMQVEDANKLLKKLEDFTKTLLNAKDVDSTYEEIESNIIEEK